MVNPRKLYPIDSALIPVFDPSGRAKLGHALGACMLLELERCGAEIAYARTKNGYEVDFLARYPGGIEVLLQLCTHLDAVSTRKRETRALLEARGEHSSATLQLISLKHEPPAELPSGISWLPTKAWLLINHLDLHR